MNNARIDDNQSAAVTPNLYLSFAKSHGVLIKQDNHQIQVLHRQGIQAKTIMELNRYITGDFVLREISDDDFEKELILSYEHDSSAAMDTIAALDSDVDLKQAVQDVDGTQDLLVSEDDAPIIRLVNAIMSQAIKENASDVHIEPGRELLKVRFRIDGILREVLAPKMYLAPLVISRIKVMAKLDISERRLPQDGRIELNMGGRAIDVRVSSLPASYGERIVMRLLEKNAMQLNLDNLKLSAQNLQTIQRLLHRPHGILIVTGPTGSGKTTTLYAGLSFLNESSRNILTVEDPVEYNINGIGQTQVNAKIDMTFARALRAILRQDPDVVMIGEIRDYETAEIAVQASLTGHLVLSTLHTNTAIGAVTRLMDIGVEPFLLSTSLIGLIAQRLVRCLCPQCKIAYTANDVECRQLGLPLENPPTLYQKQGCEQCAHVGYKGRMAVYEIVPVDRTLQSLINQNASEMELEQHARKTVPSLRSACGQVVLAGETDMAEMIRVTAGETT